MRRNTIDSLCKYWEAEQKQNRYGLLQRICSIRKNGASKKDLEMP